MDTCAFTEVELTGIDGVALERHVMSDRWLWFTVRVMAFRHMLDEHSGILVGFVILCGGSAKVKFVWQVRGLDSVP
jgi:hypothetical protein